MSLVLKDRVRETATVIGTGDAALLGAVTGFQSFSVVGNTNTCYYAIADQSGGEWEVGIGTYSTTGPTLARTTVLASSNSGSKVSFTGGTKDVFLTYPSERAVYLDASGNLTIDGSVTLSGGTANGVAYLNGSKVLTTGSALTFDGTNFATTGIITIGTTGGTANIFAKSGTGNLNIRNTNSGTNINIDFNNAAIFRTHDGTTATEQMRLTSTGLGIGTSSPSYKLDVNSGSTFISSKFTSTSTVTVIGMADSGSTANFPIIGSSGDATIFGRYGQTEKMRLDSSGNLGLGVTPTNGYGIFQYSSTNGSYMTRGDATASLAAFNSEHYLITNATLSSAGSWTARATTASTMSARPGYIVFTTDSGLTSGNSFSPTERMRIDSSGNVGIGTSVNSVFDNAAAARPLVVQSSSSATTAGSSTNSITICNSDTTTNNLSQINFAAITGASTNQYSSAWIACQYGARTNGQYPTGQLIFATSTLLNNAPSEKMRIDSSGNVGIGTSSPSARVNSFESAGNNFTGFAAQNSNSGSGLAGIEFGSDTFYKKAAIALVRQDANGKGALVFYNDSNADAANWNTGDEKMRIDSSGNLLVGTTTKKSQEKVSIDFSSNVGEGLVLSDSTIQNGTTFIAFYTSTSRIGAIVANGTTNVSYNTSSDYRLKENIKPMQNALDVVAQLNPVTYTWKADGSDGQGFIAHELQAVVPDCVTGEKDAVDAEGKQVYQGVDTSFLVATLTKAIQEQQELINQLTARVAQLEGN